MTLEEFRATRKYHTDLGRVLDDERYEGSVSQKGWVYLDSLVIERVQPHWPCYMTTPGKWYLLIENYEWIQDDLEQLEMWLYEWAMSAGYGDE
jgi:hypothetical protein